MPVRRKCKVYLGAHIKKQSTLCTYEAVFYKGIKGYEKHVVNHSLGEYVKGVASTNSVESVWAVLNVGIMVHITTLPGST